MRFITHNKYRYCKRVIRFYFEGNVRKCCCGLHGPPEDRSCFIFLSVTSWKSRSVRLVLEIYHVPQLSSFDFNQKKKPTHFLCGVNLRGMSSRVSLL